MVEFKLVLNTKNGKSSQKQVSGREAEALLGKGIGDQISGDKIGFAGYEFEITGGSDFAGFPMRKGVKGFGRKKVLLSKGVGFRGKTRWKKKKFGLRVKKTVCGETIYPKITQINLKVLKEGKEALGEEKKEEKTEKPKEELKKEAPKKEPEKTKEKKEEKEETLKEEQGGKASGSPSGEKK